MAWTNPETFTAGQTLTAASMNAISGNLDAIGDAWTSYTPTWTNLTIGNATQDCAYIAAGKLYVVRVKVTLGSTSSVGTGPEFTLPGGVSVASAYNRMVLGNASFFISPALYFGYVGASVSTSARVRIVHSDTSAGVLFFANVGATSPSTFTTGSVIEGQFMFEAA